MTVHRVRVDVDTETTRVAVWKDGHGWIEIDPSEVHFAAECPDTPRVVAARRQAEMKAYLDRRWKELT